MDRAFLEWPRPRLIVGALSHSNPEEAEVRVARLSHDGPMAPLQRQREFRGVKPPRFYIPSLNRCCGLYSLRLW